MFPSPSIDAWIRTSDGSSRISTSPGNVVLSSLPSSSGVKIGSLIRSAVSIAVSFTTGLTFGASTSGVAPSLFMRALAAVTTPGN